MQTHKLVYMVHAIKTTQTILSVFLHYAMARFFYSQDSGGLNFLDTFFVCLLVKNKVLILLQDYPLMENVQKFSSLRQTKWNQTKSK